MSSADSFDTLRELVSDCTCELFAAYEIPMAVDVRDGDAPGKELVLSGIIGFTGEQLQGTLVLSVTGGMLASASFAHSSSQDWVGELANQLLGRIKNRLLGYDIVITLSTPITVRGSHLDTEPCHSNVSPLVVRKDDEAAVIWFDVESNSVIEWVPKTSPESVVTNEGEMLLF